MNTNILGKLAVAGLLVQPVAVSAAAQGSIPAAGVQSVALPSTGAVVAFYNTYKSPPLWFRDGVPTAAAGQLVSILQRAQFDGLASGPQLTTQIEAAIRQAASGNPADVTAAEQSLSAAWVLYVQTIKRPTPGMVYTYDMLKPQGTRADQILLTAAAAPSLESHLSAVSNVNPVYAQIRSAALRQAQASGNMVPDPRLLVNLDRARTLPATGRFILVDSASQRMTMFENGRPIDSMKIIVGMNDMQTPMIASIMYYVTFNPYWNAPDHLVRKAIAPNVVRQGFPYLKSRGYEVMADWTEESAVIPSDQIDWKAVAAGKTQIRVRQKPGKDNFMGTLKFPFPNDEDIFLHDTPNKALFAKAQRNLSNGCVRLEDAARFGRWLLGREPVASSTDPEIRVQLPRGVPIYLTYLTAQPTEAGVTYTADIYGWDRAAAQQVASR